MTDPVNKPDHYANSCSLECIDVMEALLGPAGFFYFCIGNAFKYLWRHKNKGRPEEDLQKAKWYLNKACDFETAVPDGEHLLSRLTVLYLNQYRHNTKVERGESIEYSTDND